MDPTTARFIASATALSSDALAVLYEAFLERWPQSGREGSRAARVSASDHSAIDHAVRAALLPRAAELEQVRKSLHSDSKSACVIAARAVDKRLKLTENQYRALLDPFTAAGVPVPDQDHSRRRGGTLVFGLREGAAQRGRSDELAHLEQVREAEEHAVSGASEVARSYRLLRGARVALEIRGEPGPLVSTSAPPPSPGHPPVTHPFATAGFRLVEAEGELGALLRESSDLDAFLEAADRAGYHIESIEPATTQVRRLLPVAAAAEGAADVSGGTDRLVAVGRSLLATFTTDPIVNVVELPDGLGVCLVHAVRGGGKIYVSPDESALFVGSAVDFDTGLEAFRDGVRNLIERADSSDRGAAG